MAFVRLSSGQEMPILGLGLWQITDPVKFEEVVDSALELGYRHFDIAYTYRNEVSLGKVLSKWIQSGRLKREDIFVSTKLPQIGMKASLVPHFLALSLRALQFNYVDLYLIHFPVGFKYVNDNELTPIGMDGQLQIDHETNLKAVWEAMEKEVEGGRVKGIGLSNCNESQIERIWNSAKIKPTVLQVELNVYFQQVKLLEKCKALNIAPVGYGNLGSPGRIDFFKRIGRSISDLYVPNVLTDPVVVAIGTKHSKTPAQILLRFLIQSGIICIPNAHCSEHLYQNIQIFDFHLDESDMIKLKELDQGEAARSFRMTFFKGAEKHHEYPFHPSIRN